MSLESAWQPIETAPKDGEPILVVAISENEFEDAEDEEREPRQSIMVATHSSFQPGRWWLCDTMQLVHRPTHWMLLPAPPETGDAS